jgi:quercetin dioxygenase-like cupin family protein
MGETTMSKRTLTMALAGLFGAGNVGVIALSGARATPPVGVTSIPIAGPVTFDDIHAMTLDPNYTALVKTRGQSDGYVRYVKIAPGGSTGWHSHPGIAFALVQTGTLTLYHSDLMPEVYAAGTGLVEAPGDGAHIAVNEGNTDLELAVFYLIPKGAPPRIDEPALTP